MVIKHSGLTQEEIIKLVEQNKESRNRQLSSAQFSLVAQSCPTLCDPMDCSTPGFPVHHQIPGPTQTHVH